VQEIHSLNDDSFCNLKSFLFACFFRFTFLIKIRGRNIKFVFLFLIIKEAFLRSSLIFFFLFIERIVNYFQSNSSVIQIETREVPFLQASSQDLDQELLNIFIN
jgi:hypothetical protein